MDPLLPEWTFRDEAQNITVIVRCHRPFSQQEAQQAVHTWRLRAKIKSGRQYTITYTPPD